MGGRRKAGEGCWGRRVLPGLAWAAEEEGGIMLICNTVSTEVMLWDLGPTVKYKPSREKSGEKKKTFHSRIPRGGTNLKPWRV